MATEETAHHSNILKLPRAVATQDSFNIDTFEVTNFPLFPQDREILKELIKQPVIYNTDEDKDYQVHSHLHTPASILQFPLNETDRTDILKLLAAFLVTPNCAGLAACQIGINKAVLIHRISEEARDFRQDFTHPVPITLYSIHTIRPLRIKRRRIGKDVFQ
ncbi:MAG: hypothetical protein K0M45_04375 [Candidatus Paracaedibacteraceae bacterium]|nr:hypothetical protein [Candidatus Paracaedibacteraceae bacterium]